MKHSPSALRDAAAVMDVHKDRNCGIYFIQNTVTLKCYVGSSVAVTERVRHHYSYLVNNRHHSSHLQRSFDKHGVECFIWGVCEYVDDHDNLMAREQYWIEQLGDYNLCKIAGSPRGLKMTLSDVERERRRRYCKVMVESLTPEQRSFALSKAVEAKVGVPLSEEQKAKLSFATKGRKLSDEHRLKLTAINKARVVTKEDSEAKGEKIRSALANKTEEEKALWRSRLSEVAKGRPSPNKGKRMSDEARGKMSVAGKGKVISAEQKEKIRSAMLAKPPEWYTARSEKIREAKRKKSESK